VLAQGIAKYEGNKKKKRVGVPVKQNACRSGGFAFKTLTHSG
jgi:hypothetical protein